LPALKQLLILEVAPHTHQKLVVKQFSCITSEGILFMNSNNTTRPSKSSFKSGLQIDRISRIIIEQWPEIWQASINRQKQQLDNHRSLILAARNKLQERTS
jgi:hypothetical protein